MIENRCKCLSLVTFVDIIQIIITFGAQFRIDLCLNDTLYVVD